VRDGLSDHGKQNLNRGKGQSQRGSGRSQARSTREPRLG
jgi:hypothetical protein